METSAGTVQAKTIGECWKASVKTVLEHGQTHIDEDCELLEIIGLSVKVEHPNSRDTYIEAHCDRDVLERTKHKFRQGVEMPDKPFTYGQRIYDFDGVNQFEWLVERISRKPETKSATICLLRPGDPSTNIPCLTALDAKIRGGLVNLQFFFRSQNIFGRQYANLVALAEFQEELAHRLDFEVGIMQGYVASAHIYEFDRNEAKRLVRGQPIRLIDRYYTEGPSSTRSN